MQHVVAAARKSIDRVKGRVLFSQLIQGPHSLRILVPVALGIARHRQHLPLTVPARRIGQRGLFVQRSVWPRNYIPLLVRILFAFLIRIASQDQHLLGWRLFGWRHRQSPLAGETLTDAVRGVGQEALVLAHGFSTETIANLVLAGLATVVTETKNAPRGLTITVERIHITDDGRRALEG